MNFTKGEWVVNDSGDVIVKGSDGRVGYPPRPGTICSLCDGEYIENSNEYDAYLIAAAPDLYEALESLIANLTEGDFISETRIDRAVAALKKARVEV
jgi:hypothetical protein